MGARAAEWPSSRASLAWGAGSGRTVRMVELHSAAGAAPPSARVLVCVARWMLRARWGG